MVRDSRYSLRVRNEVDDNNLKNKSNDKKDIGNYSTGKPDVSNLRRSGRETSVPGQSTLSPLSTRKSKRLENETTPSNSPGTRKSERLLRHKTPSPLSKLDKGKKTLSSSSFGHKTPAKELNLSEDKSTEEKDVIQVTIESEKAEFQLEPCSRSRKRVQYSDGSPSKPDAVNGDVGNKRRKAASEYVDPVPVQVELNGTEVTDPKEGPVGPSTTCDQSQSLQNNGVTETSNLNANQICNGAEVNALESAETTALPDQQKSLHSSLLEELMKLCHILKFSEDVTDNARRFLEYIIKNHHVNSDSPALLHAFQISLCWITAIISKQKVDKKDSLLLAKQHLNYQCTEEYVQSVYLKMRPLKRMYLSEHDVNGEPLNVDEGGANVASSKLLEVKKEIIENPANEEHETDSKISKIQKICLKRQKKLLCKQQEKQKVECWLAGAKARPSEPITVTVPPLLDSRYNDGAGISHLGINTTADATRVVTESTQQLEDQNPNENVCAQGNDAEIPASKDQSVELTTEARVEVPQIARNENVSLDKNNSSSAEQLNQNEPVLQNQHNSLAEVASQESVDAVTTVQSNGVQEGGEIQGELQVGDAARTMENQSTVNSEFLFRMVPTFSPNNVAISQTMDNAAERANEAVLQEGINVNHHHHRSRYFLHPAAHQFPSFNPQPFVDPLHHELEKMTKEKDQFEKSHVDMVAQLKSDCEKEIEEMTNQIRQKYQIKLQEAEAEFTMRKTEFEKNKNKMQMTMKLAEAFRYKCQDVRLPWPSRHQQGASSSGSYMQQMHQLATQPTVRIPIGASSSFQSSPSQLNPSSSILQHVRSHPMIATSHSVAAPSVQSSQQHPSQALYPTPPSRPPPLISSITPPRNPRMPTGELRSPAPHLQSVSPAPHLQSFRPSPGPPVPPTTSPSPSQYRPVILSPTQLSQNGPGPGSGPRGGFPAQPNRSSSAVALLMEMDRGSRALTNAASIPRGVSPTHAPLEGSELGVVVGNVLGNQSSSAAANDVVCLSDDD